MTHYTDNQLKQFFPKLLPDEVRCGMVVRHGHIIWIIENTTVQKKELLYLCQLAEDRLDSDEIEEYDDLLSNGPDYPWSKTWQERVKALAVVKKLI